MTPHEAFRTFCNLILPSEFFYNIINFKKSYLENMNKACSDIMKKFNPRMYKTFQKLKINIWEIFLIEVILLPIS